MDIWLPKYTDRRIDTEDSKILDRNLKSLISKSMTILHARERVEIRDEYRCVLPCCEVLEWEYSSHEIAEVEGWAGGFDASYYFLHKNTIVKLYDNSNSLYFEKITGKINDTYILEVWALLFSSSRSCSWYSESLWSPRRHWWMIMVSVGLFPFYNIWIMRSCSGDCNIRIDLVIIVPILIIMIITWGVKKYSSWKKNDIPNQESGWQNSKW